MFLREKKKDFDGICFFFFCNPLLWLPFSLSACAHHTQTYNNTHWYKWMIKINRIRRAKSMYDDKQQNIIVTALFRRRRGRQMKCRRSSSSSSSGWNLSIPRLLPMSEHQFTRTMERGTEAVCRYMPCVYWSSRGV